jgi:quercetin dioxygenase-like cupin family protein
VSEQVYDPNRRQHYTFSHEGENIAVDILVAPGGDGPPHFHPSQEERWTVHRGQVRFKIDGRAIVPEPGVEVIVAPGSRHSFKNIGKGDAKIRAEVRPALEIEAFLTEAAELARAGYYTRQGLITSVAGARRMADFLERYEGTAVMLWPPRFIQRALTALVRFPARGT